VTLSGLGWALLLRLLIAVPLIAIGLVAEAARRREAPASVALNLRLTALYLLVDALMALTLARVAVGLVAQVPGYGFARVLGSAPSAAELAGAVVAWLVLQDLAYYTLHRAQHAVPWLWRFHAVHHSDEHVNVTTLQRMHPIEPVLQSIVLGMPLAYAFGPPADIAVPVMAVSAAWSYWIHLDLPLSLGRWSWALNTPRNHRLHHSRSSEHRDRNFAAFFPVWDRAFGTYLSPVTVAGDIRTGLETGERVATVAEAFTYPLRQSNAVYVPPS
jgi:sterol desaturase/sphingolipid hydroxylase (fatty acid hydroxylase superfamily)